MQTSHSLLTNAPLGLLSSDLAPGLDPGASSHLHSTVPDHQQSNTVSPLMEFADARLDTQRPDNLFRRLLHFPIEYTPVFHHPPIKEVNIPICTAFCSSCSVAVPPKWLQVVDRDGNIAYCVSCLAAYSHPEDFSAHAFATPSNSAPLSFNDEDTQYTLHESSNLHESPIVEELSSASVPFSSEHGSSSTLGNFSGLVSPASELSHSAFAEGNSSCTVRDTSVTFAPVAVEPLAPHFRET